MVISINLKALPMSQALCQSYMFYLFAKNKIAAFFPIFGVSCSWPLFKLARHVTRSSRQYTYFNIIPDALRSFLVDHLPTFF